MKLAFVRPPLWLVVTLSSIGERGENPWGCRYTDVGDLPVGLDRDYWKTATKDVVALMWSGNASWIRL